jgi:hypothetical protein
MRLAAGVLNLAEEGMRERTVSDVEYFAHRADMARGAAMKAKGMASFRAHMVMAQEYERRARGFTPRHAEKVVLD